MLFNVSGGSDLAMSEISEAAKIITASIDQNAKVIFGAVQDDNLKKGEIQVTVIAAGFSTPLSKNIPATQAATYFGSAGGNGSMSNKKEDSLIPDKPAPEVIDSTTEDDEFEIPAFIRRKMK